MKLCIKCFTPFEGGEYDKFNRAKICGSCAYKNLMKFCGLDPEQALKCDEGGEVD